MKLSCNGKKQNFDTNRLSEIVESVVGKAVVAVSVNGLMVARDEVGDWMLNPGDDIIIVTPMQGG